MPSQKIYGDNTTTNSDPSTDTNQTTITRTPRIDVYDSEMMYYLRLSIPGVRNKNLTIQFVNGEDLEIKGHVEPSHPQNISDLVTQEIFEGPFHRLIRFPVKVQTETIQFDYHGGILEIYIEKIGNEGVK